MNIITILKKKKKKKGKIIQITNIEEKNIKKKINIV